MPVWLETFRDDLDLQASWLALLARQLRRGSFVPLELEAIQATPADDTIKIHTHPYYAYR